MVLTEHAVALVSRIPYSVDASQIYHALRAALKSRHEGVWWPLTARGICSTLATNRRLDTLTHSRCSKYCWHHESQIVAQVCTVQGLQHS